MTTQEFEIRMAACAVNQTALDIAGNSLRIQQAIEQARSLNVQVLCLPELCLTGYGSEDMFLSEGFVEQAARELIALKATTEGMVVSVGLPLLLDGSVYNCAALLANGVILGFAAKQHLAKEGLHYEPRWFRPWPKGSVASIEMAGNAVPIGDIVFDVGGLRIGFEICEDAWVQESRPLKNLVERGVNLILNPSASHFAFGKNEVRKRIVRAAVEQFPIAYIYANLLGNEAGRAIYDGDAYVANNGDILVTGPRFSFQDHRITVADLVVTPTSVQSAPGLVVRDWTWSRRQDLTSCDNEEFAWERSEFLKEEEFSRAVALGLFDYVRKSRSAGVVISLSGGADSAAVACLSRLMLDFAFSEIGKQKTAERLAYLGDNAPNSCVDQWLGYLICTAYQSTCNSSDITRRAALDVAHGVGSTHYELDVNDLVEGYKHLVSKCIGRDLDWEKDDIALQNIQARTRSPSIWMFANIRGALLLSTSNRSEAAVGYATMDGDTSGGLAPIAGIDKAFLRRWLLWLETHGVAGLTPFSFLKRVNQQQPTAELRPPSHGQTDEEDLMPYPVLDLIERAAVRDKLMPKQILSRLVSQFDSVSRAQCVVWITRFFRLWCRNQWKRERYAPSFHLDDESLDPKTWCRFPILSGGFEVELNEMERELSSS